MAKSRGKSHRSGKGGYPPWQQIQDYRTGQRFRAKRSAASRKGWKTRRKNAAKAGKEQP